MLQARINLLPPAQKALWPELAEVPRHFVLYGGTALALRLGHRESVDFDFFSSRPVIPGELLRDLQVLRGAKILQNAGQTLSVSLERGGTIKLSFFGGISIGRVGEPDLTQDTVLCVASLLDVAGTKAAVITQRAEAKDYLDMLAIIESGTPLPLAMAAARALYGSEYNPMMTLKSLAYFGDGDLYKLTQVQKDRLTSIASQPPDALPDLQRTSDDLSPYSS